MPKRKNRQNDNRIPAWVWLFTGCVAGAFVMFLMRLSELDPVSQIADKAPPAEPKTSQQSEPNQENQPRFDFYHRLKETKVPIPDFMKDDSNATSSNATQPKTREEYILQVASFKNSKDAEQLKVQLILLNLEATIEKVRIRNGETWYRVLVGPFKSRSQREKALSALVSNKYHVLVLKRAVK